MTTTLTSDVNATLQQIAELTATGCDIVRVACPSQDDADALAEIAQHSQIPVIADIHFQPKYVFAAIDAGCAAVRVNPGNIRKFDDQVKEIARAAKDRGTSIRIGVNAGSLDKRLLEKYGKATPEALVESAVWEAGLFEEHDFHDFKISVKHNDPVVMVRAYELLAEAGDWPLHLGVTEAGPAFQGTIKSATAFGALLSQGIGDTIRVSLSAPPVEEVKVGIQILQSLNLRPRKLEIVSCPSCGRAQVDVYTLAEQVTAGLEGMEVPLRVAVMGCVVNGPGEAREADLGVASGNGKGQIFVKGEVIKTVPESQIVETLIEEAMRIAEGMESVDGAAASGHRLLRCRVGLGCRRAHDPPRRPPPRGRGPGRLPGARAPRPGGERLRRLPRPTTNLEPRWLGGEMWGRFEAGELAAACHVGANLVPVRGDADDAAAFAERALARGRTVSTIVGPQDAVRDLLERRRQHLGPARARPAGTSRTWRSRPARWSRPTRSVRRTTREDLHELYPACVAMYTEEVGVSPEYGGGADLYRARVTQLVNRGWSFARFDDTGRLVFKAEVACATPYAAQIQGVFVPADRRGLGLATAGHGRGGRSWSAARSPRSSRSTSTTGTPRRAPSTSGSASCETARFATVMF